MIHAKSELAIGQSSFLALLYRFLPTTRPAIRRGVIQEYSSFESLLCRLRPRDYGQVELDENFDPQMMNKLLEAGFNIDEKVFSEKRIELGGERISEPRKLLGLIMVPGAFGLNVPFNLVLRILNKEGGQFLSNILRNADVFSWFVDDMGDISLGPRNVLEATLWVKSNVGDARAEIEYRCSWGHRAK